MVGHAGVSHSAQQDGVLVPELIDAVLGHHRTLAQVSLAGPVVVRGVAEGKAVAAAEDIEDLLCGQQDLSADAVAGDQSDAVIRHGVDCSTGPGRRPRRRSDLPYKQPQSASAGLRPRRGQEGRGGG